MICPMVEASEMIEAENVLDYTKVLRAELPGLRIEYLHGKMKGKEKNQTLSCCGYAVMSADFADGGCSSDDFDFSFTGRKTIKRIRG